MCVGVCEVGTATEHVISGETLMAELTLNRAEFKFQDKLFAVILWRWIHGDPSLQEEELFTKVSEP